jgi:uracil-DNA glycosylase
LVITFIEWDVVVQVRRGAANSHRSRGWETFTDAVVKELDARKSNLVFLLWGKPAQVRSNYQALG